MHDPGAGAGEQAKASQEHGTQAEWFALQVKQRSEGLVSSVLENKGVEHFLPMRSVRREWCDRVIDAQVPLFPGYLFCRLNLRARILPVLTTPGVMRIVGAGRTPVPVSEDEIEAVRRILSSGLSPSPWPVPHVGEKVRLLSGPLKGLEGVLIAVKKQYRLVVTVSLLNRAVAVEIDSECAGPVGEGAAPAGSKPESGTARSPKMLSFKAAAG
jgi:transcription antitermination factor NusG